MVKQGQMWSIVEAANQYLPDAHSGSETPEGKPRDVINLVHRAGKVHAPEGAHTHSHRGMSRPRSPAQRAEGGIPPSCLPRHPSGEGGASPPRLHSPAGTRSPRRFLPFSARAACRRGLLFLGVLRLPWALPARGTRGSDRSRCSRAALSLGEAALA